MQKPLDCVFFGKLREAAESGDSMFNAILRLSKENQGVSIFSLTEKELCTNSNHKKK